MSNDDEDTDDKPVQDSPANTVKTAANEAFRVLQSVNAMVPFISKSTYNRLQEALTSIELITRSCDRDISMGTIEEKTR